MSEERLRKIYRQYKKFAVEEKFKLTFEQFVTLVEMGRWLEAMDSGRLPLVHKGHLEEVVL